MRRDEPVPAVVRTEALAAFAHRRSGERRLVPLVWDGDADPAPGPGRPVGSVDLPADPDRVGADPRHLWFLGEGLAVEAWIGRRGPRYVSGALTPPGVGAVAVERDVAGGPGSVGARTASDGGAAVTTALVGDDGRFLLPLPQRGAVRFAVRRPGRPVAVTAWVLLDAQ